MDLNNIRIVLVNTTHPGNIGASARAMKNMGLTTLYLVEPRDFPSGVAIGRASGAVDILDRAVVCDTLRDAVADCSLVIGTSARSRSIPWPVLGPPESADKLVAASRCNQTALVFGRESRGLSNEELQHCHYHVQIPASEEYSSLNVAAAVMVLCYEVRQAMLRLTDKPRPDEIARWDRELATMRDIDILLKHLESLMIRLDFHDPDNPRQLIPRLRRLSTRIHPDKMEVNIIHGILTAIEQGLDNT